MKSLDDKFQNTHNVYIPLQEQGKEDSPEPEPTKVAIKPDVDLFEGNLYFKHILVCYLIPYI